jgi:uncharacterized protein YlzI (FlbEa/FlbD family)
MYQPMYICGYNTEINGKTTQFVKIGKSMRHPTREYEVIKTYIPSYIPEFNNNNIDIYNENKNYYSQQIGISGEHELPFHRYGYINIPFIEKVENIPSCELYIINIKNSSIKEVVEELVDAIENMYADDFNPNDLTDNDEDDYDEDDDDEDEDDEDEDFIIKNSNKKVITRQSYTRSSKCVKYM